MKILLLGANGQVGTELRRSLAALGSVVAATRSGRLSDGADGMAIDLAKPAALGEAIAGVQPDVVVNAAAYTAVDRAEEDSGTAFGINAEAPAALAAACLAQDCLLVHYSTDYVFDGTATRPYVETDPTGPLGVYGASKLAGERAIQDSGARHMIFRTAWVHAAHGSNFLLTMLRLAAERDHLRVVSDQVGSPTSAALIADTTAGVLARGTSRSGLWHLTASGHTSWYGFAAAIVDGAFARGLLTRKPAVEPIATAEYPTPARRPAYACLDTSKLAVDFGVGLSSWQLGMGGVLDALAELPARG